MNHAETLPNPALTLQETTRLSAVVNRPEVQKLLALLNDQQARTMIVGGAVRNALLDRAVTDIDLATTLVPEEVIARAKKAKIKTVATGLEHGTLTLVCDSHAFEVTTLRKDIETDGRHATIAYSASFVEDAERRDFTMNALYADQHAMLYDPVSGLDDLRKGHLRFLGNAQTRIREDYLRILRFFRFFADYADDSIDATGLAACIALKDGLATLSRERIACDTVKLMQDNDLLASFLPARISVHRLASLLTLAPQCEPMTRLFVLLWPDQPMIAACQAALRLSNGQTKHLSDLDKALRSLPEPRAQGIEPPPSLHLWAFRQGQQITREALLLHAAESGHTRAELDALYAQIADVPERSPFSGRDFLELGCKAGPVLGKMLEKVEALWIDEGFPSDREAHKALVLRVVNQEKH